MHRFSFKKGLKFLRGQFSWRIVRRLPDKRIQWESDDGEIQTTNEAEIMSLLGQGTLAIDLDADVEVDLKRPYVSRDLATYPQAYQDQAAYRMKYVSAVFEQGILWYPKPLQQLVNAVSADIGDTNPPSHTTLCRWLYRYKKHNSITSLISRRCNGGRKSSLVPEVAAALDEAIDTIFLNQQRHPRKEVIARMKLQLERTGQQHLLPSQATIYRYLSNLEAYDVVEGREGKAAAKQKFRSVLGKQQASDILERVEIDHTPLNILVYCEHGKRGNGRPWLTAAIDKHSRLVVGYYISYRTPSTYAVLQCLRQAILPKDALLASYPDITTPWPARGIPAVVVCDNGMELHSHSFSQVCLELGVQIQFCPAKKPQYKGSIERFLKTINHDLIHQLPGTVFSNPDERGDYPSEKLSCISFETLNHQILKWIVEVYNATPHRGIGGTTPLAQWQKGEERAVLEHPAEPAQLDVILGQPANRRVFHYGVEVNSLYYNNDELQSLRRHHGEALHVDLKFYEDDIGFIHVFNPEMGAYFRVDAIDQDYAQGTTLQMHEIVKESARHNSKDSQATLRLLQKREELQKIVDEALKAKKMANRKKAAVFKGINTSGSTLRNSEKKPKKTAPTIQNKTIALPKLVIRSRNHRDDRRDHNE